jgi:Uma2 family endonuclease
MNSRMASLPQKHLISVDEYYRMAEVGLLAPDARVELIEGEIIDMPPIGIDHAGVVSLLNHVFVRAVDTRAVVQPQAGVRLDRRSEPQPDLAILAPREDFYRRKHPAPEDVLLLIEVSDSTLRYDLDVKAPLYARHGIPELWVVDLPHGEMHVFRAAQGGQYIEHRIVREPCVMGVTGLPGVEIDLSRLFVG